LTWWGQDPRNLGGKEVRTLAQKVQKHGVTPEGSKRLEHCWGKQRLDKKNKKKLKNHKTEQLQRIKYHAFQRKTLSVGAGLYLGERRKFCPADISLQGGEKKENNTLLSIKADVSGKKPHNVLRTHQNWVFDAATRPARPDEKKKKSKSSNIDDSQQNQEEIKSRHGMLRRLEGEPGGPLPWGFTLTDKKMVWSGTGTRKKTGGGNGSRQIKKS